MGGALIAITAGLLLATEVGPGSSWTAYVAAFDVVIVAAGGVALVGAVIAHPSSPVARRPVCATARAHGQARSATAIRGGAFAAAVDGTTQAGSARLGCRCGAGERCPDEGRRSTPAGEMKPKPCGPLKI